MPLILVAEDDPDVRRLVLRVLRARGYQVVEAMDGIEAQDLFAQHAPDLVLTDWHMPRMDGLTLAHWIRAQHAIPIVVMSGDTVPDGLADGTLGKPFTLQALTETVCASLRLVSSSA